jgi:hypothetical protein
MFNYKLEIKKFIRLANRQRNTFCSNDTITNQDIRANLNSVKTEYKFLHTPTIPPSSFNSHKWPDSLGHYSIAVKDPLRAANGISLDESARKIPVAKKFSKYEIHTSKVTR